MVGARRARELLSIQAGIASSAVARNSPEATRKASSSCIIQTPNGTDPQYRHGWSKAEFRVFRLRVSAALGLWASTLGLRV